MECLRWKREALEVEVRLADQRRSKILEAIEASREDDDVDDEGDEEEFQTADEKVRSAFKNLIHRLKTNPFVIDQQVNDFQTFHL